MNQKIRKIYNQEIFKELKIDCQNCFGICCVALYFSKSEGFPNDKVGGKPCANLQSQFRCLIHENLDNEGLKGCTSYDCFGAGQKIAQVTFKGHDWRKSEKIANGMFDAFLIMRQLNEMLWYLYDASTFKSSDIIEKDIECMIYETKKLTNLDYESMINIDIENHRMKVNAILKRLTEVINEKVKDDKITNSKSKKDFKVGYDYIGSDMKNVNLIGANLAGIFLIAADMKNVNLKGANLIGADLRDTDLRGANLEEAMFVTQVQINSAKGDLKTKLPKGICIPNHWKKG